MKCDPQYAPGLTYGNASANFSANANQSAPWDAYTDESLGSDAKHAASKLYQSFDIALVLPFFTFSTPNVSPRLPSRTNAFHSAELSSTRAARFKRPPTCLPAP